VLQNEVGNRKTASMVAFSGEQRFLGDSAVAQASGNVLNSIHSFKNLLRVNNVNHPEMKVEQQFLPFKFVDVGNGAAGIEVTYDGKKEVFSPQQIAAAMFAKLKVIAEAGLGVKVTDCVITVPPMWTEDERRAVLDAAQIAGLNVLRLMNENLAVAVSYGLLRKLPAEPIKVLFVDVGASHTNASVVLFHESKLQVLSAATDPQFGGRSFDLFLFNHFAEQIKQKYKMDVTTNVKATLKLFKEAAAVKIKLSANNTVPWAVEFIMNDRDVNGTITRAQPQRRDHLGAGAGQHDRGGTALAGAGGRRLPHSSGAARHPDHLRRARREQDVRRRRGRGQGRRAAVRHAQPAHPRARLRRGGHPALRHRRGVGSAHGAHASATRRAPIPCADAAASL